MIRPLRPADAEPAARLIRLAFANQAIQTDPPPGALSETTATIAAHIAEHGGACASQTGALAATILWQRQPGALYLSRLAVHPAHRGQGLARALLDAATAEAARRNLPRLRLATRLTLMANRRLFAAWGFTETAVETHPGYTAPTSVTLEKPLQP